LWLAAALTDFRNRTVPWFEQKTHRRTSLLDKADCLRVGDVDCAAAVDLDQDVTDLEQNVESLMPR